MSATVALGVAFLLQGLLALMSARDQYIPIWMAVLAPMVALVAISQPLWLMGADIAPEFLGLIYIDVAPRGWAFVGIGVVSYVGGFLPLFQRRRGEGSMALAQVGAVCISAGLLWTSYLEHYGTLWSMWNETPRAIADAQTHIVTWFTPWLVGTGGALVALMTPPLLMGSLRAKKRAAGEALAALVMVGLFALWIKPMVQRLVALEDVYSHTCEVVKAAGVVMREGREPMGKREVIRGEDGELYHFVPPRWERFLPQGPVDVAYMAYLTDNVGSIDRHLALLPEGSTSILAGIGERPGDPEELFGRHPVLRSSWCRGTSWPVEGAQPHQSLKFAMER
jgi:hypothetical protein